MNNTASREIKKVAEILTFWFAGVTDETRIDKKADPFKKWFTKDANFDQAIRTRFENNLVAAQTGHYKEWEKTAAGRLALIILFDQFSRNLYRGTPKMFENDPLALNLTLRSIQEGMARDIQALSIECFGKLVNESQQKNPANVPYFEYSLGYAKQHRDIVERFGRFPHRNVILSRATTPAEQIFLAQPGSSF